MTAYRKPFPGSLLLCILDGFGDRPIATGNAIAAAHTPHLNQLRNICPKSRLLTHGAAVGLPAGQMGNSEVGHMNLGSGRILMQALERVQSDLASGAFMAREQVQAFIAKAKKARAVHLLGLVSDGGVHSHMGHASELAKVLSKALPDKPIYIHAILDGRDTAPRAALEQLALFEQTIADLKNVKIASISGRFYTMDRDKRWERVERAYNLMVNGTAAYNAKTARSAIERAYGRDEGDEFVEPTTLPALDEGGTLQDGDVLFCFNFRADRMRQIVHALVDDAFDGFTRTKQPKLVAVATMTQYDATLAGKVTEIYPPEKPEGLLGEIVSAAGLKQLRIAETEKYAHVTFFFNGGDETPFAGEDRILVNSPKVRTYDLQPQMSLPELTEKLVGAIGSKKYDVIICNVANGDMVGHTGNLEAATKAVEAIDEALGKISAAIRAAGGEMLITADHGNVEELQDASGNPMTAHSINPVPFIYQGRKVKAMHDGRLCDVAPTMLALLGLKPSADMTGTNLIELAR